MPHTWVLSTFVGIHRWNVMSLFIGFHMSASGLTKPQPMEDPPSPNRIQNSPKMQSGQPPQSDLEWIRVGGSPSWFTAIYSALEGSEGSHSTSTQIHTHIRRNGHCAVGSHSFAWFGSCSFGLEDAWSSTFGLRLWGCTCGPAIPRTRGKLIVERNVKYDGIIWEMRGQLGKHFFFWNHVSCGTPVDRDTVVRHVCCMHEKYS